MNKAMAKRFEGQPTRKRERDKTRFFVVNRMAYAFARTETAPMRSRREVVSKNVGQRIDNAYDKPRKQRDSLDSYANRWLLYPL